MESGTPPADVCRQLGWSEANFYIWKKRYGNLGMTEVVGYELHELTTIELVMRDRLAGTVATDKV